MSGKPSVYYSDLGGAPVVGAIAWVFVRQHYRLNLPEGGAWLHTSKVLAITRYTEDGPVFETLNTIYVPHVSESYVPQVPVFAEVQA